MFDEALKDTIRRFEETGSPVITDGEQTKPSFATYPVSGLKNLSPDGVVIPFADGHSRRLPKITSGPFHYQTYASSYLEKAKQLNFDLSGAVLASDAFFPFDVCVKIAHAAGITSFIQPGGSIRDKDSIEYCKQNGLAMVITGLRHFKH